MYIGIDAGGTKADLCICDSKGHILLRKTAPGINAARLGAIAAADKLAELIGPAYVGAHSIYAGTAGAGSPAIADAITVRLQTLMPSVPIITVSSDAFNGLNAEIGLGDGIALIAGTGSSAFVRCDGHISQVGGRGYLIDDAGSGYWTGRACLNAAYRALDGRGRETALTAMTESVLNMPLAECIPVIYEKGPSFVASFAPLVFEAAASGDPVAQDIAGECARELWLHLRTCHARMDDRPGVSCVASGGMFRSEYLRAQLISLAEASGIDIIYSETPPVAGAVIAAAGSSAEAEFTNNLKGELNGLR